MSRFSVEIFFSHSTGTFRRGTLLCCVSQNCWWRKRLWKRSGEGGLSKLSVENFLSHSTETLLEEPFSAVFQKIAGSEKVYGKEGRGGSIEIFRRKFFVSKCQKVSLGNFYLSLFSGIEKSYASEGYVTIFCQNFFLSQFRNLS